MTRPMNGSLEHHLAAIVGEVHVIRERSRLLAYASDGLPGHHAMARLAVLPGTREEVVAVVRNISAHGGQAEVRLTTEPPAEIAALLDDVNGMQTRLADSYRQLEQALINTADRRLQRAAFPLTVQSEIIHLKSQGDPL